MSSPELDERVLILNPVSGDAEHVEAVRDRAAILGYPVRETQGAGDAITIARAAAEDGVSVIAAAGGDGTLNEVVRGVDRAGAFDRVTVGVIPVGTGNDFAQNIGIQTIDDGFDVLEDGERRRIDLGRANGRVFVNSCIGGLTADASEETSAEMKTRLGVLAYVVTTLRTLTSFDGLRLSITTRKSGAQTPPWEGEAICVLVGNGRLFTLEGSRQADMEDELLDVVIIEDVPAVDLMGDAVAERMLGGDAENITRRQASTVEIDGQVPEPINFSLDGEMIQSESLSVDVQPARLRLPVGDAYEVDPDD